MKTREELRKRCEELEMRLFYIEMVDRFTEEDWEMKRKVEEEIKEIKEKLKNI